MNKRLLRLVQEGKFYWTKEWRQKRKDIFKRDNKECQKCKVKGKFSKAQCVHHIKHLEEYPLLALTDSNLISLCNKCHNEEHPEKLIEYKKPVPKFENKERW